MPQTNGADATPIPPAPIDPSILLDLRLSVGQINKLLAIIGTQPLAEVLDLYTAIRTQGDTAIAVRGLLTKVAAAPPESPSPPAPLAPPAPIPRPDPARRHRRR